MDNETKHTSGPWKIVDWDESLWSDGGAETQEARDCSWFPAISIATEDDPHGYVAYVDAAMDGEPELARANARLIAAAPELLETLKDLLERFERVCPDADFKIDPADKRRIARVREIITKAKGGR